MTWILFLIVLEADRFYVSPNGMYPTMNDCFEAREFLLATAPQPKVNYDAICVATNKVEIN